MVGLRLLIATAKEDGASVAPDAVAIYGLRLLIATAIEGDASVASDAVASYGLRLLIATAVEGDASVSPHAVEFSLNRYPQCILTGAVEDADPRPVSRLRSSPALRMRSSF